MNVKKRNDCAEEIALVLDKYLDRPVVDGRGMECINDLIRKQIEITKELQRMENQGDEINGGSR